MMAVALLLSLSVQTLTGERVDPFLANARATVFVFVQPECPISNRYVPEVNRIDAEYADRGIRMWVVYPGRDDGIEAMRAHYREYGLRPPALLDPEFALADLAGVTITPEAAVFTSGSSRKPQRIYLGRIDDRALRLGLVRAEPRTRDLADVLARITRGDRVDPYQTQAVGCYIRPIP